MLSNITMPSQSSSSLIGRQDLIVKGLAHIESTPSSKIAFLGPHGIGKTSLARAFLADVKVRNHFHEACYFVTCEPLKSGHELALAILQSIDIAVHPHEQDVASFMYQQLLKVEKSLLVVDSLDSLWSEPDSDSGANDVVLRIVELLGSLYTVSLIITESGVKHPSSVDWTLLLSEGGLPSLKPDDALLLFRHGHIGGVKPSQSNKLYTAGNKATFCALQLHVCSEYSRVGGEGED